MSKNIIDTLSNDECHTILNMLAYQAYGHSAEVIIDNNIVIIKFKYCNLHVFGYQEDKPHAQCYFSASTWKTALMSMIEWISRDEKHFIACVKAYPHPILTHNSCLEELIIKMNLMIDVK